MKTETKVKAATGGAGLGAVLSGLLLWLLDRWVDTVPAPVEGAVVALVPAAVALVAGWLAPHTPRPDPGEVATESTTWE